MHPASPHSLPELPPIVLFVDDDPDTLAMYSTYFEASGVWVATSTAPAEAVDAIAHLKPDCVVTDIGFRGVPAGLDLVHTLKSREDTCRIPIVVLSGRSIVDVPEATRREADICLEKPVLPDELLLQVRNQLKQSVRLRSGSDDVRARTASLTAAAGQAMRRAGDLAERVESRRRPCPGCGSRLDWIERGRLGGADYDYYRWCLAGCGLYCYDRNTLRWIKLA